MHLLDNSVKVICIVRACHFLSVRAQIIDAEYGTSRAVYNFDDLTSSSAQQDIETAIADAIDMSGPKVKTSSTSLPVRDEGVTCVAVFTSHTV